MTGYRVQVNVSGRICAGATQGWYLVDPVSTRKTVHTSEAIVHWLIQDSDAQTATRSREQNFPRFFEPQKGDVPEMASAVNKRPNDEATQGPAVLRMRRLPRVPFVAHGRARVAIFPTSPSIKVSELAINGRMVKFFLYQVLRLDHKQKHVKLIQAHHSLSGLGGGFGVVSDGLHVVHYVGLEADEAHLRSTVRGGREPGWSLALCNLWTITLSEITGSPKGWFVHGRQFWQLQGVAFTMNLDNWDLKKVKVAFSGGGANPLQ
ncbi:hypothetical protein CPB86DRAFT_802151 [Serendipita vermifera]|nr:hypothetical protein CPB86DRAFT_802151 [Serendipita vermifera]